MNCRGAIFFAFVASANTSAAVTRSPVEKVVGLLEDLQAKLRADGTVEQQVYDKYACWCEATTARKAKAIEAGKLELRRLGQTVLSLKGTVSVLVSEIDRLTTDIKANIAAQEEATALRQTDHENYIAETAELKQAIIALQKAVQVLVAGTSSSLLAVSDVLGALPRHFSPRSAKVKSLIQFANAGLSQYAPQSQTVQGILKDMYETFANDLEGSTTAEATAQRDFEALIATKAAELKALEESRAQKEAQKVEAEVLLADATQTFEDTQRQLKADVEFFDSTKASCAAKSAEWKGRKSMRDEELEGIKKALEILTSDAARELFDSAIKDGKETHTDDAYSSGLDISPSFLQFARSSGSSHDAAKMRLQAAYDAMKRAASASRSVHLAALAARLRSEGVGHFEKVLEAIDRMIAALQEEDTADIAKRDQCKAEYTKIASTSADLAWKIEQNEARIQKLETLVDQRRQEVSETSDSIHEVSEQIHAMKEERREENRAFLHAKKDDEDAINLLMQARVALEAYFKKHDIELGPIQGSVKGLVLRQTQQPSEPTFNVSEDQAPDATFAHKDSRKQESKGIVSIMTYLIQDLNDEISNGLKAEAEAQKDHEVQLSMAETLKEDLITKRENLHAQIANLNEEKVGEKAKKDQNGLELDTETKYKTKITPDCDWIIGAFEKRAARRTAEMNGLTSAKAFLVGGASVSGENAPSSGFLQKHA